MVNLDKIKSLAKAKGWSLSYLCKQLGLASSYFTDVRNGKNSISDTRLEVIAELLDTTAEYLKGKTKTEVKDTPADFGAKVREIVEFIQSDASEEDKNEALRTIISKIVYDKASDNIDIHYYI